METAGHYWLSVYSFLFEKGFLLHVINSIQTDGWHRRPEIRKRKNDIIDSVLIADLIRYGQFVETRLAAEELFSLHTLPRFRTYLVKSISDLKRKVVSVLNQVFPRISIHLFQHFWQDLKRDSSPVLLASPLPETASPSNLKC